MNLLPHEFKASVSRSIRNRKLYRFSAVFGEKDFGDALSRRDI